MIKPGLLCVAFSQVIRLRTSGADAEPWGPQERTGTLPWKLLREGEKNNFKTEGRANWSDRTKTNLLRIVADSFFVNWLKFAVTTSVREPYGRWKEESHAKQWLRSRGGGGREDLWGGRRICEEGRICDSVANMMFWLQSRRYTGGCPVYTTSGKNSAAESIFLNSLQQKHKFWLTNVTVIY